MDIKIVENVKNIKCDALILGKFVGKATTNDLVEKFAPEDFVGKKGQIFSINTQNLAPAKEFVAVGMGEESQFSADVMREAIAKAVKHCIAKKAQKIAIDFGTNYAFVSPAIVGAEVANYAFDKYKTKKEHKISELYLSNVVDTCVTTTKVVAEAIEFARDLANEPAAYSTPSKLADIAQSFEELETVIYDADKIETYGMGAYLAVSKGSSEPPKFIHMKYNHPNPKKRIAIIGKGLCFDSGGLDLKPASSMLNMKDDMSGAACVLAVMRAITKLDPDVEVHGIIAACENMPSGSSYKPGDILVAKNGKTIEVDNTDAEGRLTLADALCYACELNVDEVIDIATLTGACMVALGSVASGIMGNNQEFIDKIVKTGEYCGERYWQLPMWKEYRDNLNSDIADMKNTGSRWGGASSAGMFLKEFVTDSVKWAHIDIAGTSYLDKPQNEFGKGATGVGVRTLLKYIISQ